MLKFPKFVALALVASFACGSAYAGKYNIGRQATKAEVAAWNIDIRPDGQGLPEGKGTVGEGEKVYAEKCASCHGDFGEGVDRWPVLSGGADTLSSEDPVKTIGSYWPYLSTVFDYVNRAMPFNEARSLEADEVYAITAYLLYVNDVIEDEKFELSKANFLKTRLPNEKNFFADDRTKSPIFAKNKPCMKNCKRNVEITARAQVLDVTPDEQEVN